MAAPPPPHRAAAQRSRRIAVGAHDPAVASRLRRTGPATPGCVPGPPIYPATRTGTRPGGGLSIAPNRAGYAGRACPAHQSSRGHAYGHTTRRWLLDCAEQGRLRRGACPAHQSVRPRRHTAAVRQPGTHRPGGLLLGAAGGLPPARRVPLRVPRPTGLVGHAYGHTTRRWLLRLRRTGPATPGCVPGPPICPAAAHGRVRARTGPANLACAWLQPGIARRPAVCPYVASAHRSRLATRTGTRPGGGLSIAPNRAGYAGCVPGPPICPAAGGTPASLFVDRARIGPANRPVPAHPGIAAGPPCAPTWRLPAIHNDPCPPCHPRRTRLIMPRNPRGLLATGTPGQHPPSSLYLRQPSNLYTHPERSK